MCSLLCGAHLLCACIVNQCSIYGPSLHLGPLCLHSAECVRRARSTLTARLKAVLQCGRRLSAGPLHLFARHGRQLSPVARGLSLGPQPMGGHPTGLAPTYCHPRGRLSGQVGAQSTEARGPISWPARGDQSRGCAVWAAKGAHFQ